MAKYKPYSYAQGQFIPVFFNKQTQEGNMEQLFTGQIDDYAADTNVIVAWRKNCRCSSSCLPRIDWFAAKAYRHRPAKTGGIK